jgi:hypothetical protein
LVMGDWGKPGRDELLYLLFANSEALLG